MDALGKKYDQRFKAAGEVSSRLQAEEAAFRDIQVWHSSIQLGWVFLGMMTSWLDVDTLRVRIGDILSRV
jgi:hypothetical protein